ncbi:tRNA lysidine(34) synthetase TilS [Gramella sp. AN32]|uniref:tRNA(Ile)-lysidine synthase n=1 Tax=Christiangramia antarctica TaxID=2058158 RepID=A0ABW5X206_9FLAO|nr:tRNA lysidine(34) synthetase TilS [Gramella sp. AN32]MCM4155637.1 tRNA lysidine(34) synthetase TilS [Gramella sp. AN32]
MEKDFKNLIKTRFPYLCTNKILLAISGGVDSVVLAHLCASSKLDFSMAHCNFNLRDEESDGDENFVVDLADSLNVEIFTENFDTEKFASDKGISIQMAARELRYTWFKELASNLHYDYILTAHHANDNLETFLINLIRGTGPEGLTGIKAENNNVIRPLLHFSRKEIESFARKQKYKWREDSSNASEKYLRNKIRHSMVPLMEEINPQLLESFAKTQRYLRSNLDLVDDYMSLLYPKLIQKKDFGYAIELTYLKKLPNQKEILYQLLKSFGFTEWNDIYNLINAQSGKVVFSETHRLIKDRDQLLLTHNQSGDKQKHYSVEKNENYVILPMGTLAISKVSKLGTPAKNCIFVPKSKLQFPICIRKWQKGDFFYPFGMSGKKKLSRFFKDEKFSLPEKENTWILASGEEIVWVINHRMDNRFAVSEEDSAILKLCVT